MLISAHSSPDGDSIGSQLAVYDLCVKCGCEAMIVNHDPAVPKYAFLSRHQLINVYTPDSNYPDFDLAVLLEAPVVDRIGDVQSLLPDGCFVINIDHHHDNTDHGSLNYVDESAAATGVMIYELFEEAEISLTKDNADELFTAILTDTGRFRFSNTTPSAMRICARLLELGASPQRISNALYACYLERQLRVMGELLMSMEIHHKGRTCVLASHRDLRERYPEDSDEIEGLADYTLFSCGVRVGVLLREIGDKKIKVSLRSSDDVDVAAVARLHGGGGHRNAAGCYIHQTLSEAKELLLREIQEVLPT